MPQNPNPQNPLRRVNRFVGRLVSLANPLLESVTGERKLTKIYKSVPYDTFANPADFAEWALRKLRVYYDFPPEHVLRELREIKGPIVFYCNHPFGGMEAFIMIRLMAKIRPNYHVLLRSNLADLKEHKDLDEVFILPKDESEAVSKARALLRAIEEGDLITLFPALDQGNDAEENLDWDTDVAKIIHKAKATVVPVYFHGRKKILLEFLGYWTPNIRKLFSPREFLSNQNKEIRYRVGKKISYDKIKALIKLQETDKEKRYEEVNTLLKSKLALLSLKFVKGSALENFINIGMVPVQRFFGNNHNANEPIIPAIAPELMQQELDALPPAALLADSNGFVVYALQQKQAPNVLKEIGRLREITFRDVGEGSGKACDLDRHDEDYYQLVLWDKAKQQIAGGYRVGKMDELYAQKGTEGIYLTSIFYIKESLLAQISPQALELGRSYVVKEYQRSYNPLLMLWTGIAHFVLLPENRKYRYLIGPVSISAEMHDTSKTLIVNFMEQNNLAQDLKDFARPKHPFQADNKAKAYYEQYYHTFAVEDTRDLNDAITELEDGAGIPVLFKHYLKMGARMIAFNVDPDFSDVLDCLMITDLTRTDQHLLGKYMGRENVEGYLAEHQTAK